MKKDVDIAKLNLKDSLFIVNINRTHPCFFGDPVEKEFIKGAASGCWQADYKRLKECKYVVALLNGIVAGVFKTKEIIQAKFAADHLQKLVLNITYPPYRQYEIIAHTYKNGDEIREKLGKHISIFHSVVKVDIDDQKEFKKWQERYFLILEDCENEELNNLNGCLLLKDGKPILFGKAKNYHIVKE